MMVVGCKGTVVVDRTVSVVANCRDDPGRVVDRDWVM